MKKAISLMLAFVLCLSLCACGKSEAVKNTEALIDAIGEVTIDSESAILAAEEAYNALSDEEKAVVENYQALCDARASLDELLFLHSFLGKWIEIRSGMTFVFNEDGTGTYEEGSASVPITYEVIDETVRVNVYGLQLDFYMVVDADGITHFQNFECDCVRESDFEAMKPKAIEITVENWNTYFEIREIVALIKNEFGEYTDVEITSGIFLKDEYLEVLSEQAGFYPSEVTFEVQYDHLYKNLEFDKATGEYSLSKENYYPEFSGREINIITTMDWRYSAPALEVGCIREYVQNDPAEHLVAQIYDISWAGGSGVEATSYGMNFEVLRATGTIYLNN